MPGSKANLLPCMLIFKQVAVLLHGCSEGAEHSCFCGMAGFLVRLNSVCAAMHVLGSPLGGRGRLAEQAWLLQRPAHRRPGSPYCWSGSHALAGRQPMPRAGSRTSGPAAWANGSISQLCPSALCLHHSSLHHDALQVLSPRAMQDELSAANVCVEWSQPEVRFDLCDLR